MKVLIIDNYDSFVYNLAYLIKQFGIMPDVVRNDKLTLESVMPYDKILLSPGPGIPDEAGLMKAIIREYAATKSFFGVCLGHQAIGEVFGAKLRNLDQVLHGVSSVIHKTRHSGALYNHVPDHFKACHYHSWVIDESSLPDCLEVTAVNETGLIMGVQHKDYEIYSVQYHPESYATEHGRMIVENWLKL